MQHASVKSLFKEQVKVYSHHNQYKRSPLARLTLTWLKNKKRGKKIEICEFGGGAGQLLGYLQKKYPRARYTNVEIIEDYKQFLASDKIRFIVGSVLSSGFPDKSFDVIIMRDVLHHLVGRSYHETLDNQKLALTELKRMVKPGGAIFIEELTNESEVSTRLIYYLTRINSQIGINIPSLSISSNIIVSFLTHRTLSDLCKTIFGKENSKTKTLVLETPWHVSLVHVFGRLQKTIITATKK